MQNRQCSLRSVGKRLMKQFSINMNYELNLGKERSAIRKQNAHVTFKSQLPVLVAAVWLHVTGKAAWQPVLITDCQQVTQSLAFSVLSLFLFWCWIYFSQYVKFRQSPLILLD